MELIQHPSPNFDDRPNDVIVDLLVLHYTGMETGAAALDRMCDPAAEVSAHYMVEEDGKVFQLVNETKRAWHAGKSYWRGRSGLNACSIGIEIVNPGHEFGYRAFPQIQMDAVKDLCISIMGRHMIPARNVVGHSDIAPSRKEDPGELFDWPFLAEAGVGLWPFFVSDSPTSFDVPTALQRYGYTGAPDDLIAFKRHFCPERLDLAWGETDSAILHSLLQCI